MFNRNKISIFIDESGTLPDPKDKIIVVAAVGSKTPDKILEVNKKVRKRLKQRKKKEQVSEIKLNNSSYQNGNFNNFNHGASGIPGGAIDSFQHQIS